MGDFKTHVVIADTQFLVVEALKAVLGEDERLLISGVAQNRHELNRLFEKVVVDLLITDTNLFDYSGADELKTIKHFNPGLKILVLTNQLTKDEFTALTRVGVNNIIYKTAGREEILTAVEFAARGKKFYGSEILDMITAGKENRHEPEAPAHLTQSELDIVRLIVTGLTTKEIASKKSISIHTANTHRKNIFRKLNVNNVSELIMYAIKSGWIDSIEYYI
ncbi:LuxR C-terminal-related transcriptional regulator [Gaoshiqia sp. Z1-71]|uniref:LuxR C-terminal-related transcriptional regulator n=1 Tax=Gaoshiqia hydrogeniformans TaxID=3290090 RepID=UPI003BF87F20